MSPESAEPSPPGTLAGADWQERVDHVVDTMRRISLQRDPQTVVRLYGEHVQRLNPIDRLLSVSRRGLEPPRYRIARNSDWGENQPNPWKERERLPVLSGGLIGELAYGNRPVLIDRLEVAEDDPGREYLKGMRSLIAIPVYDQGEALNTAIMLRRAPAAFDREQFPMQVWLTNLFGRATHNLVLSEELREAHAHLDRQQAIVGEIQRKLLPPELPRIPNLDLSVHYEAAENAGGDYYDVLPLGDGRWGLLVADVSGHGTPAAVLMAITRAITHLVPSGLTKPGEFLGFLNEHLAESYTRGTGTFVTAFYGVFCPESRVLEYSLAGHPPPRFKRCSDQSLHILEGAARLPLGIQPDHDYVDHAVALRPGDQIAIYTDGITEARDGEGAFYGFERLDRALDDCQADADGMVSAIVRSVRRFTGNLPAYDDATLLVARVG